MVASIRVIYPTATAGSIACVTEGQRRLVSLATRFVAAAIMVLAFVSGAWPVSAEASNIRFVGNVAYKYTGNVVVLTADEIANFDASGVSGPLRLELWAVTAPFDGGPVTGYKLAEYALGQLVAGFSYSNVSSGSVPFTPPPEGKWTFNMFVTEYTSGPAVNDGCLPINSTSDNVHTACLHASGWIKPNP